MDPGFRARFQQPRGDAGGARRLAAFVPRQHVGRLVALVLCAVVISGFALSMALCTGLEALLHAVQQPGLAFASAFAALSFGVPYLLIILWLDRNEREPWHLVLGALIWGAVTATAVSGIFNSVSLHIFGAVTPSEAAAAQLTASFSAPFIEELSKGLALGMLYLFFHKEFDGVLDGLIYGAIIGLGFAVYENFTYYVSTGSLGGVVLLTWVRGFLSGLGTHVTFTAITGIGFGLSRVLRRGWWRGLLPPLFLALAMFCHFAWNTFAEVFMSSGNPLFDLFLGMPIAVLVLQIPFVLFVVCVACISLFFEARMIRRYLADEKAPVVRAGEREQLVPARRRALHSLGLFFTLRWGQLSRSRRRNHRLVRLAFERWHMDREKQVGNAERAGEHAQRVLHLRELLSTR
jgi:protease PrsW